MKNTGYPIGEDIIWLATDGEHIAAFVTAGRGPIPVPVFEAVKSLEEAEVVAMELPVICSSKVMVSVPRPDDFIALASRGLFVYDWSDFHKAERKYLRKYELVAVPVTPVSISMARPLFSRLARAVVLPASTIGREIFLDVSRYVSCLSPMEKD